jgi:hypothetical protein
MFKLHKIAFVISTLAVLCGGLGTAYASDGGFPYERYGLHVSSAQTSGTYEPA